MFKLMWVGRATVLLVGFAVILALVFGAASAALGANGQPFILGENNAATALSRLTGNVDGSTMQVVNNNAGADDSALHLSVQQGEAPMRVNSSTRVAKLNADKLDGHDAPLAAQVNYSGGLVRGIGATSSSRSTTGLYRVNFNRNVSGCMYSVTLGGTGAFEPTGVGQATGGGPNTVSVSTANLSGSQANRGFHLIVVC